MNIALILAAAGSSSRLGISQKKEYLPMDSLLYSGQHGTVLSVAAEAFFSSANICALAVTIPPSISDAKEEAQKALFASSYVKTRCEKIPVLFVQGGKTRQESVYNALNSLNTLCNDNYHIDFVAVHDGARPYVSAKVICNAIETAVSYGTAVPAIPPVDTQKEIDGRGVIVRHLDRKCIIAVQTPQVFRFTGLLYAHKSASTDGKEYTDDTAVWAAYNSPVHISEGDIKNIKITYSSDIPKLR